MMKGIARPIRTKIASGSLADARRRVAQRKDAIDKIRRLPTPSEDIEDRLRACVAGLSGALSISGVEEGEGLAVDWGKEPMTGQPKEPTSLQVAALMHPEELIQGLLRKVRRDALGSCPPSERPGRIRELEREIEQLERIEEALVLRELAAGRPVERRSDASPAAVLQVKVAEKPAVEAKKARVA
jgi:hypothetical protein